MLAGSAADLASLMRGEIDKRNEAAAAFFQLQAPLIAKAARGMAERFLRGGRLLIFGSGAYATDAQHVSVEFVHPVLVGKRALPALDLSIAPTDWIRAIAGSDDMVLGFGPPDADVSNEPALAHAREVGAMTIALPGTQGDYAPPSPHADAHIHQELFETLTHALYESVHVFLEHRDFGEPQSASDFLYPFLGTQSESLDTVQNEATESVLSKAADAAALRERVKNEALPSLEEAILAMRRRIDAGATMFFFGNGGSATDANDWALDCVLGDGAPRSLRAISLSLEPACITAIANDVGVEVIFLRQLIAQAKSRDIAVALSTSGGSKNVIAALVDARKRGMLTVALLGYDGGQILREGLADHTIVVRSDYIPRIQEVQATIYHLIRRGLDVVDAHAA